MLGLVQGSWRRCVCVWGRGALSFLFSAARQWRASQHQCACTRSVCLLETLLAPVILSFCPSVILSSCRCLTSLVPCCPCLYPASAIVPLLLPAAGIYTHSPEQLEEAGKYLEEKRAAMKGVKIVTELEPTKMYYKAEVNGLGRRLLPGSVLLVGRRLHGQGSIHWLPRIRSMLCCAHAPAIRHSIWVADSLADVVWCAVVCSVLFCAALSPAVPGTWWAIQSAAGPIQGLQR